MKNITKTLIVSVAALIMLVAGAAAVKATSDADLGVTLSCSGDTCTATSLYNDDTITFQKNNTKVGPFPKSGEVRLYFQILSGASSDMAGNVQVKLTKGSTTKTLTMQDTEEIIDTDLFVNQGDYVYVKVIDIGDGNAVGWHEPWSGNDCGSGFTLPRTGGVRTGFYQFVDVTSEMSWARQANEPVVQDMCWADWPEWEGDYDFEDYFIALSYVPGNHVLPTVDLKVNGSDSTIYLQEPADYTLSWTSQNANSCYASSGFWSGTKSIYGSEPVYDKPQGTYNYGITCSNNYGSASDSVSVVVNPTTNPQTYIYIQKTSREIGATSTLFIEDLYTYPSKEVEFSLVVTLSGNTSASVLVRDVLPEGLSYISGSTTIDGLGANDGIIGYGINLGTMYSGQTKTVKFRVLVRENGYFSQPVTRLINTAIADAGNGRTATDTTNVWVIKTGRVLAATDVDTGPEEMLMAGGYSSIVSLLMAGLQTGRKAYWKRQIKLIRAK
jgi:uncharacterized repeat protein (TIGR01451 family)